MSSWNELHTWSILRWYPKPGAPVPVRGRDPTTCWGLPDNTQAEQEEVDADSILLLRLMFLQSLAARAAHTKGLGPPLKANEVVEGEDVAQEMVCPPVAEKPSCTMVGD